MFSPIKQRLKGCHPSHTILLHWFRTRKGKKICEVARTLRSSITSDVDIVSRALPFLRDCSLVWMCNTFLFLIDFSLVWICNTFPFLTDCSLVWMCNPFPFLIDCSEVWVCNTCSRLMAKSLFVRVNHTTIRCSLGR